MAEKSKSGSKAGGYNQNKKTRESFLDSAFDHMQNKKSKKKYPKKKKS